MKKFYEAPELELIKFHQEDVLSASTGEPGYEDIGGGSKPVGPGVNFPE